MLWIGPGHFVLLAVLGTCYMQVEAQDMKKSSQCFKSRGIPRVEFDCAEGEMIKINKAFHGITSGPRDVPGAEVCEPSPGREANNCTFCDGDCVDDSMNLVYDWSICMGNTSCHKTVMQSYMPSCTGKDKFSDYLQVEYQCIPRTTVLDVCSDVQKWINSGYLMSPGYPNHYPTNLDCMCTLQTDYTSKFVFGFYDLLLETKKGRCRADWLMLRQKGQKHRHCGAIMTGTKNFTSDSSIISLQFHTDQNDNRSQSFQYFQRNLKGFWLHFTVEPAATIQVNCRKLTKEDREVQEISDDDAEYDEVVSTKDMLSTTETTGGSTDMDEMDYEENEIDNMETEYPKTKNPRKGKKKKNQFGEENEVDYQEGHSGASSHRSAELLAVLANIFVLGITFRWH